MCVYEIENKETFRNWNLVFACTWVWLCWESCVSSVICYVWLLSSLSIIEGACEAKVRSSPWIGSSRYERCRLTVVFLPFLFALRFHFFNPVFLLALALFSGLKTPAAAFFFASFVACVVCVLVSPVSLCKMGWSVYSCFFSTFHSLAHDFFVPPTFILKFFLGGEAPTPARIIIYIEYFLSLSSWSLCLCERCCCCFRRFRLFQPKSNYLAILVQCFLLKATCPRMGFARLRSKQNYSRISFFVLLWHSDHGCSIFIRQRKNDGFFSAILFSSGTKYSLAAETKKRKRNEFMLFFLCAYWHVYVCVWELCANCHICCILCLEKSSKTLEYSLGCEIESPVCVLSLRAVLWRVVRVGKMTTTFFSR